MPSTFDEMNALLEKAKELAETKAEIFKLNIARKVTLTLSGILVMLFVAVAVMLALIILSIGVALWIGNKLGDPSYGFFIVALFYMIAGLIFYALRKKVLKDPISNYIIDKIVD